MKLQQSLLVLLLVFVAGVRAAAQTTETHSFLNLNRAVPDGNASGLSDHQTVTSAIASIGSLRVNLYVNSEFNGDLYAYLRHVHAGTTNFCVLLNRPGRTATAPWGYNDAGLDVTFDDTAANGDLHNYRTVATPPAGTPLTGSWRPDGRDVDPYAVLNTSARTTSLGSFNGANPDGEWTLFLADVDSGATNLLVSWELIITGGAVPVVTWPTPADIVYGTALGPAQLNATASVAGSFTYTPPAGTVFDAGAAQTLSVTFTPTDTTTYVPVTQTVSLNVLRKDLTITAANASKVYGAALPAFTANYSGFVAGDTPASLDSPASVGTTATAASPVGSYPITVGGATDANYAIAFVNGTLTILPASTTGMVTSSANPAPPGQSVTFTFEVGAVPPGAGLPTGSVQFMVDGAGADAPAALSAGVAQLSLSTLTAGVHSVAARYAGDGNFLGTTNALAQAQLINSTPVVVGDTIERHPLTGAKVLVATLLGNDTDANGDALQLLSVSATSAHGGTVTRIGDWVYYTPATGFTNADSFTYTIVDAYNAQATGTVVVAINADLVPTPNLVLTDLGNGSFRLSFDGIPGKTYRIEFSEGLAPPAWQQVGSGTADPAGMFEFIYTPPAGTPQLFYRSVYP